jgi:hypothetical protein
MYTLSFRKFTDPGNFPNDNVKLYVVRDRRDFLYIGVSKKNVWGRWFNQSRGRMRKDVYGNWVTHDAIGAYIARNLPGSLKWQVDLWRIDECADFLQTPSTYLFSVESFMIAALLPRINRQGNTSIFSAEYYNSRREYYFDYIDGRRIKWTSSATAVISEGRKESRAQEFGLPTEDDIPF